MVKFHQELGRYGWTKLNVQEMRLQLTSVREIIGEFMIVHMLKMLELSVPLVSNFTFLLW